MTSHPLPIDPRNSGAGNGHGRTVLVTGGGRGLGAAAALALAGRGAGVVLLGRDQARLDATVRAVRERGGDGTAVVCDITDPAAVRSVPRHLADRGVPPPDVLVHAAAVMSDRTAKTLRTDDEHWRAVMATNLDATFTLLSTFVPAMVARRDGRVVVFSACLGRMTGPGTAGGLAPYRVSKAGVNALVRNLAHELGLGSRGVLVDATCPGHCRTDMGGPDAPRSPEQGAATAVELALRPVAGADGVRATTGVLWEDGAIVPW